MYVSVVSCCLWNMTWSFIHSFHRIFRGEPRRMPHKRSEQALPASSDFHYLSPSSLFTTDYSSTSSGSTFSGYSTASSGSTFSGYSSASFGSTFSGYSSASSGSTFSGSSSRYSMPRFVHGAVHDVEVGYVSKETKNQFRYVHMCH